MAGERLYMLPGDLSSRIIVSPLQPVSLDLKVAGKETSIHAGLFCLFNPLRHNVFLAGPEFVQVICPSLHHLPPLWQELGAIVCSSVRIEDYVTQLKFDDRDINTKYFVENGPCCRTKTMGARQFLTDANTP